MKSEFLIALTQIASEKNLPKEVVLAAVEAALTSAYKKENLKADVDISVRINPATGQVKVYTRKAVVEVASDLDKEISLAEARKLKATAEVGEFVEAESIPVNAGRIAAQTAKQIVLQRLRDAEHDAIFKEYAGREGNIVSGVIQQIKPSHIVVDMGRSEAILPVSEQVRGEGYRVGQRLKLYVVEVIRSTKGTEIIVSRSHRNLLGRLLELEVSEIGKGIVEIKGIAREAGYRSKVAVAAKQAGVDPVGCCVGPRAIRIQNIVRELQGEKIDVVEWNDDPARLIVNALSPAQVVKVNTDDGKKIATVVVPDRQLSLAIGKEGQNARLAAKLTGWRIDIKSLSKLEAEKPPVAPPVEAPYREVVELAGEIVEKAMEQPPAEVAPVQQEKMEALLVEAAEKVKEEVAVPPMAEEVVEAEKEEAEEEKEGAEFEEYVPSEVFLAPASTARGESQIRFAEDIVELAHLRHSGKEKRAWKKASKGDTKKEVSPGGGKGKRSKRG